MGIMYEMIGVHVSTMLPPVPDTLFTGVWPGLSESVSRERLGHGVRGHGIRDGRRQHGWTMRMHWIRTAVQRAVWMMHERHLAIVVRIDGPRRSHALLLLPSVAEPNANNLLLELQTVRQRGNFLSRWLRLFVEVALECSFHRHLDARPLLPLSSLRRNLVDAPELQGLEPADGRLTEHVAVERAEREPHVGLREAQLDPPLLELLRELLQVVRRGGVVLAALLVLRVGGRLVVHVSVQHGRMMGHLSPAVRAGQHPVDAVVLQRRRPVRRGHRQVVSRRHARVPS
uniref:Uncharacterized protein n=1 Tax=Strigamia maritima TaxID=126957 RepID=T1JLJ8_STRMM